MLQFSFAYNFPSRYLMGTGCVCGLFWNVLSEFTGLLPIFPVCYRAWAGFGPVRAGFMRRCPRNVHFIKIFESFYAENMQEK